jgi:hypothetical protein
MVALNSLPAFLAIAIWTLMRVAELLHVIGDINQVLPKELKEPSTDAVLYQLLRQLFVI